MRLQFPGQLSQAISGGKTVNSITLAGNITYYAYWAFTWTDPEGTAHMFTPQTTHKPAPPEKCSNPPDTPSGSSYAVDGSGYLAVISPGLWRRTAL